MAQGMNLIERIRFVWGVVEVAVEEAVIAAEGFVELKTGAERKAYVVQHVTNLLKELEGRYDILPTWAEIFVLKTASFALDWIVERVFARLNKEGKVNVPA